MTKPTDPHSLSTELDATHVGDSHFDESYCAACGSSYPLTVDTCPEDGARLTKLKAQRDALIGRVFDGRYEVKQPIGRGGMGTVYRGWQLSVDREVAIKVIHPKLADDRSAVKRFLREARLSSRLSQPSIVNVYDFGQTDDGILYLVMELLRGHTLAHELESQRPLPLRRVVTIATQLCDALASAHGQGIIHRDLKPGNLVILDDPPGRDLIKVLDFGLAKSLVNDTSSVATNTSALLGTPLYMAPEQIEGKATDQRTDLYSLGCLLYQMLVGLPPFLGENVNVVLAKHISAPLPPLPPHVPPALAATIRQLCEKDPPQRPASAAAVRAALQPVELRDSAELHDTTPELRPSQMPMELAVTAAPVAPVSPPAVASPRRRWLAPLLVGGIAAGAAVAYLATRAPSRSVVVVDAGVAAPAVDAGLGTPALAIDAAPLDAIVIDAAVPVDAGTRPRPKPPRPRPRPVDAGAGEPSLEFIPPSSR